MTKKDWIPNILEGSYKLKLDDLKSLSPRVLADTFMDRAVKLKVLNRCLEKEALLFLKQTIDEKKLIKFYTCSLCGKEAQ